MLVRAPYTLTFVFLVRHALKDKEIGYRRYDIAAQSRAARRMESSESSASLDVGDSAKIHKIIKNENVTMNTNVPDHHEQHSHEHLKQDDISEAEQPARPNCTSGKKENQRYSSSFIGNVTKRGDELNVDKEFKDIIGKAKTISSVHEDEDITLCWIETTTIKENKTVQPPRRLVIREYTISFENSATIPDKYLECKKLEGELTPNDEEINKTALFEIIDEDTKVSRVVNFTSISHVGDVIIWQYKKVKCGVGPVVSKNIVEWNDGSKKPKKRVEIKVSPKLQKLTATKTEEEEPCTESSVEDENENSSDVTTEFCKNMNGACEVTTKSEDISIKSTTEISISEEVTESKEEAESESEEDLSLSSDVTKPSILFGEEIFTSTVEPITNEEIVSCEQDSSDPSCTTQKNIMHSSSLEEVFTEAGATTEISSIHQEIVTEKDIFDKEKLPQFSSKLEKEKEVSDSITDESTLLPSTTDILIKSSVTTPKNIDYTVSTSETNITTSHGATKDEKEEENLTSTDNSKDTSTELTSEELTETDHVPSLSTINSAEINAEQEVTTKVSPHEITEFVKESETFTEILNKLSSISTESIPESVTSQSISTLEEVLFQGTTTTSSSTEIKSTASSEVDYSCENSEDCAYINSPESCDEFGNCDSVTSSSCESSICSEEETEDQSKPDTIFLPTKNQSFVTESQSSEQLATSEIQHTTVASVPTTLIAQDTESNSTMINMDTRRTTTTSKPQHILSLKVKILLEHINEKKEKHNLVEVEKHVSFDENSIQENHPDLLKQLKALNESVNNETLSALLKCIGPIRAKLDNLIEKTNINSMQSNDVDKSHKESEYTDFSAFEDLISEQFTSERALAKNEDFQYSEYDQENDRENEVLYRRRRRRSLDDKKGNLDALDIVTKSSIDPDELSVTTNSLNVSELQTTSLTETTHPSTTTNNPEEGTNYVTENERNTTTEGNDGVTFSTIKNNDTDSTTLEYQDVNVTKESVQLSTTTNNPQEETSDTVRTESGNDTTTEIVLSTVPSVSENVANETKIEVVQVLPEIQKDVSTGLKHVFTELTQNNLTSVNDTNKTVKTNLLLKIIADPKDNRVHSRIRRAAAEEVGHWSNERIREMSMGGSLRTFTEFTLYKVLS
ncbi:mucin-22-like isoform X2 [Cataglyphis hispanica]|uniref:mucin-22-like isoform X2 n=1 Tax=Cataglyphis hispanica TaxID=1086592 RepID=UPI00217F9E5D|nr:mucin-22-like isoform X2 [Cataglyphis hispanica]